MESSMSLTRMPVYKNRNGKRPPRAEYEGRHKLRGPCISRSKRAKSHGRLHDGMPWVLFISPMDAERREVAGRKALGAFEPMMLEDLPEGERDAVWATADVIVTMGFPREFPPDFRTKAPQVRLIQSLVAGVDHLPFDRFPAGAIVCGNAGAYNVSVAEHAMALLLAAAKDVPARTDEIRRGVFRQGVTNKGL